MPNGFLSPRRRLRGAEDRPGRRLRGQAREADTRAVFHEVSQERRGSVYRTDAEFTGVEASPPLPRGAQLDALLVEVRRLRGLSVSQLRIAEMLCLDVSQVQHLCKRFRIPKGENV